MQKEGASGYLSRDRRLARHPHGSASNILSLEVGENDVGAAARRITGCFASTMQSSGFAYVRKHSRRPSLQFDHSIFTDREGVVWIGTNRGVSRYDPVGPLQSQVSDSPNGNFIRTLWQSGDGRAMFAGSNRGLFYFDGKGWQLVNGFDGAVVYAINQVAGDELVGTSAGSFSLTGNVGKLFTSKGPRVADGDTRSFAEFRGRTYAAIFGRGVIDLAPSNQAPIVADETVTTLLTSGGKLWIGTAGHGLLSSTEAHQKLKPLLM